MGITNWSNGFVFTLDHSVIGNRSIPYLLKIIPYKLRPIHNSELFVEDSFDF